MWAMAVLVWAMRGTTPRQVLWRWMLGSALLGVAVGVKWAAVPYVAFAGLAFVFIRLRDANWEPSGALAGEDQRNWTGLGTMRGLAIMAAVSIGTYFLTFLPAFFYAENPMTPAALIPFQLDMYRLQTQVLAPHVYQAKWYTWPLMLRPIWAFYEYYDGAQRGVLIIGNPLVMVGGLVAVGACIWAWVRSRAILPLTMALLWIASLGIYIIIPKSLGFYYYYHLSGIFLCLALAVAFDHFEWSRKRGLEEWFLAASLLVFVFFYPIISAWPLSDTGSFNFWMWLPSWR
jgi:dolichyl-phosphate-mannose--protein O-mannosyl transferase